MTRFAAYKSTEYTKAIKGADAELRQARMRQYETQLVTENNVTTRSARAAKEWDKIQRGKERFPNIEYLASRSADRRKEHEKYYGMILPVDHPFWRSGFPPNGYNCKCGTRPTRKAATRAIDPPKLPKGITGNAGINQEVFKENHAFISVKKTVKRNMNQQFERLKKEIPFPAKPDVKYKNGSSITVHTYADRADLKVNVQVAQIIAKKFKNTKIRIAPHNNVNKIKNPEYLVNGKVADLKKQFGNQVASNIKSAVGQECEVIIFHIQNSYPHGVRRLSERIRGALAQKTHTVERFFIIDKKDVVFEFRT